MNRNKYLLLASGVIVFIITFFIVSMPRLTITAPKGAEVEVRSTKDNKYKKLGSSGNEKYSAWTEVDVSVRVTKDKKSSVKSARLERFRTKTITMSLEPLAIKKSATSSLRIPRALKDPYLEGEFIYGINPNTNELSFVDTKGRGSLKYNFIGLPGAKKVFWDDLDNYTYSSTDGRVIFIKNGEKYEPKDTRDHPYAFFDLAKAINSNLTVLSDGYGVYSLDGQGTLSQLQKIKKDSPVELFASGKDVVIATENFVPTKDTDDITEEVVISKSLGYRLRFVESSNKLSEPVRFGNVRNINSVATIKDNIYLASSSGINYFNKTSGKTGTLNLGSLPTTNINIIDIGGRLLMVNDQGVWRYDFEKQAFDLLTELDGGDYVLGSLAASKDDTVIFSTLTTEGGARIGATFVISF